MKKVLFATTALATFAGEVDVRVTNPGPTPTVTGTVSGQQGSITVQAPVKGPNYSVGGSVNVTDNMSVNGSITVNPGGGNDTGSIGLKYQF